MERNWTSQQREVIDARDSSLLVFAAAGSGKTAVLAQRILEQIMDKDKPLDIDRILVVTFTKAAAGEMRDRIRKVLEQSLEKDPDNEHLQRQCALVSHAWIMTIDSFCLEVIRTHFPLIGLDPGFRVADEGENKLLFKDVLEKMLEEEYEKAEPSFRLAADILSTGRSDDELERAIERFYTFSMAYPWPKEWRHSCLEIYRCEDIRQLEEVSWMQDLLHKTGEQLADLYGIMQSALQICGEEDGPYMYADTIRQEAEGFLTEERIIGYEAMRRKVVDVVNSFGKMPACRDKAVNPEKRDRVKKIRDTVKTAVKNRILPYYRTDLQTVLETMQGCLPFLEELVRLTDRFEERFSEEKRRRDLVDFADLEHMALQILIDRSDGEDRPSAAAKEYAAHFSCIMTDEYQDSNLVQELLLSSVSGEEQGKYNRFMVGDVKQSIYRFRLARPEVFMERTSEYGADGEKRRKIGLSRNFRSRDEVLSAVNTLFAQIMQADVGGVDYTAEQWLYRGAEFPDPPQPQTYLPEIWLVRSETEEEIEDDQADPMTGIRAEAVLTASRIRDMVGKEMIYDRRIDAMRPVRYGDIAILLRSVSSVGDVYSEILTQAQIPSYIGTGGGYFDALEVRTVLSWLAVIDNPHQDIALAAALLSPAGGLNDAQAALIRIAGGENDLYTACRLYLELENADSQTQAKLAVFLERIDRLRRLSAYTPIHELIWKLLDLTGYGRFVKAMPGGALREANLQMLVEKAISFENGSYRGLFHFLRYIDNLKKYEVDYAQASVTGEEEDTVRIMTIHKSKGLEFPVVFVGGMGRGFNRSDQKENLIMHPILGLSCRYVDPEKRLRLPVLYREVLAMRGLEEGLGEELRVLYVAMTRACEKLIMTGSVKEVDPALDGWLGKGFRKDGILSYTSRMEARCFLDLLMPAVLRHVSSETFLEEQGKRLPDAAIREGSGYLLFRTDADWAVKTLEQLKKADPEEAYGETDRQAREDQLSERMREQFRFELTPDPVREELDRILRLVPAKVSVSDLKVAAFEDAEDTKTLYPAEQNSYMEADADQPADTPDQHCGQEGRQSERSTMTGAERGTIWHRVMELFDFTRIHEADFVTKQLESMVKYGKITQAQRRAVSPGRLRAFFASDLAKRMCQAAREGRLHRETPFVISRPAAQLNAAWECTEDVLIQGIIDVWFEEADGIVLLDYKTDAAAEGEEQKLLDKYRVQIELYRQALETITHMPVKECMLYSFSRSSVLSYDR